MTLRAKDSSPPLRATRSISTIRPNRLSYRSMVRSPSALGPAQYGYRLRRRAGIDREHRAGHAARLFTQQKRDRVRYIIHAGEPAERAAAGDLDALLFGQAMRHFGIDETGRHGIHVDAEPPHFARQRARKAKHR